MKPNKLAQKRQKNQKHQHYISKRHVLKSKLCSKIPDKNHITCARFDVVLH